MSAVTVGRLQDGAPYYAPIGEMVRDENGAMCHLCGRWLKIVAGQHLTRIHGIDVETYREMFHLSPSTPTCSLDQSANRRVITARRAAIEDGFGDIGAQPELRARAASAPRRVPRWRSLAATRPDLAAELHLTRNGEIDPFTVAAQSKRKLWWRCGRCGHEWRDSTTHRSEGRGCPSCARSVVLAAARLVSRERSLGVLNPMLAAELHPTRNGTLDPYTLGANAKQKVWWMCGGCGHEWRAVVGNRHRNGAGCPGCAAQVRARRFAALRPELAAELHPTRNAGMRAEQCWGIAASRWSGGNARPAGMNGKPLHAADARADAEHAPAPAPTGHSHTSIARDP